MGFFFFLSEEEINKSYFSVLHEAVVKVKEQKEVRRFQNRWMIHDPYHSYQYVSTCLQLNGPEFSYSPTNKAAAIGFGLSAL